MTDKPLQVLETLDFPKQEDISSNPDDRGELAYIDGYLYGLADRCAIDYESAERCVEQLNAIKRRLPDGSPALNYLNALLAVAKYQGYRKQ